MSDIDKDEEDDINNLLGGVSTGSNSAREELVQLIIRKENLFEAREEVNEDIRELDRDIKGRGYDIKVVRKIVALRKIDSNVLAESEAIEDLYRNVVGLPTRG